MTTFELGDHRHNSSPLGEDLFCGLRAHPLFETHRLRGRTHQDESSINSCFDEISENPSRRKLDQSGVRTNDDEESAGVTLMAVAVQGVLDHDDGGCRDHREENSTSLGSAAWNPSVTGSLHHGLLRAVRPRSRSGSAKLHQASDQLHTSRRHDLLHAGRPRTRGGSPKLHQASPRRQ